MKVIARNSGPKINGQEGNLTPGKQYEVISISIQRKESGIGINWLDEPIVPESTYYNPKSPEFFINIINDRGTKGSYWNDYFYPPRKLESFPLKKFYLKKNPYIYIN